jgi:hypothetical protein
MAFDLVSRHDPESEAARKAAELLAASEDGGLGRGMRSMSHS